MCDITVNSEPIKVNLLRVDLLDDKKKRNNWNIGKIINHFFTIKFSIRQGSFPFPSWHSRRFLSMYSVQEQFPLL